MNLSLRLCSFRNNALDYDYRKVAPETQKLLHGYASYTTLHDSGVQLYILYRTFCNQICASKARDIKDMDEAEILRLWAFTLRQVKSDIFWQLEAWDIDTRDSNDMSVFMNAMITTTRIYLNHREHRAWPAFILCLLHESKEVNVSLVRLQGQNYLHMHLAQIEPRKEILERLVQKGVDFNAHDFRLSTPTDYALKYGHMSL
jgi:hypothetical protein